MSKSADATTKQAEQLAALIKQTIAAQGYFVGDRETLTLLWSEETLPPAEKLVRLHRFAAGHGWHATTRDECNAALFQSTRQRPVSADSWRLDGNIERALAGSFSTSRLRSGDGPNASVGRATRSGQRRTRQ